MNRLAPLMGIMIWAVITMAAFPASAEIRLPIVRGDAAAGVERIQNGDFEQVENGRPVGWSPWKQGFSPAPGQGRNNSMAVTCVWQADGEEYGADNNVILNQTQPTPILVRGWSRAENVDGAADSGYSLYCDLEYMDGTPLWGQITPFGTGTHDWQQREVFIVPAKPVRSLTIHCLFREHRGQVWFDDVQALEMQVAAGIALLDGVAVVPAAAGAATAAGEEIRGGGVGLRYDAATGAVGSVSVGRKLLPAGVGPGGFLVRDVAANSDWHGFSDGQCAALDLALELQWRTGDEGIRLSGTVHDTSGQDRAVTLMFALPVDARGDQWGGDIHTSQTIAEKEYSDMVTVGTGTTGTMSRYPFSAIYGEDYGLTLGLDLDRPCQYRLAYNAYTQQYFVAFDLALVPDTRAFPSAAPFGLTLTSFSSEWGFRAAAQRYYELFPEAFLCRSKEQGIWMPFAKISRVQGWEDFGFKYKEGNDETVWDDEHGILTFSYTEPSTWWMSMPEDMPRTYEAAMAEARRLAAAGNTKAKALLTSGIFDDQGRYMMLFRNEPWCNGAVFSNSCLPGIEGEINDARVAWNEQVKEQRYGPNRVGDLDGEYLDSLEGYVTSDVNFRREHFAVAHRPLTFTRTDHRPVIHKGFAVDEFTEWIARDVHGLGKLMFANAVPYRFTFLCRHLDVMGTETNWLWQGRWGPWAHSSLGMVRTLCAQKPYLFLQNTQFEPFGPYVERYFQRCLLYGMYPSFFSPDASTGNYWTLPELYNRDRELHRKYQPVIRRVGEAGWQPITLARADTPGILLERFGPNAAGESFITVFNDGSEVQTARVRLDASLGAAAATELLSGQTLALTDGTFEVTLAPEACLAVMVTR